MSPCEICGQEAGMYQLCENCHNEEIAKDHEAGMLGIGDSDLEREHGYHDPLEDEYTQSYINRPDDYGKSY